MAEDDRQGRWEAEPDAPKGIVSFPPGHWSMLVQPLLVLGEGRGEDPTPQK